jgi:hypothetical protein
MPDLIDVAFGHGSVQLIPKVDAVPTTSKTTGNTTVNVVGSPEKPGYFQTSFMLSCDFSEAGREFSNIFHWTVVTPLGDKSVSYTEVEADAARQLAPMLRAAADKVEQLVAEFDAKPEAGSGK